MHQKHVLYGCPQYFINRLQKVQNNAARLILKIPKIDHIMPHVLTLHWLPLDARIQYKICSLASMLSTLLVHSTLLTYLRFMHLLANSSLLLTLVHCAFLQYTQKPMANMLFHTLHLLSGTIFRKLPKTQTLNNRCVCVCACVCVCVCLICISLFSSYKCTL